MRDTGWRTKLLLLWLCGVSLRLTMLAVPPLLSQIHHQLRLSETAVGTLTGLPVVLLGVAAVPGSLLVAKLGARRGALLGLTVVAVAGAARGLGSSVVILFAMTFLMGCGVAASQPTLPSLVRTWLPSRIGLGTASFANGLLMGEILAVALTIPLIVPFLGRAWQPVLASWSVPVMVTAMAVYVFTREEPSRGESPPARWWPDWRDHRTWLIGLTLGGASASYWGANAFLPDYLRLHHHAGLITPALTALNVTQLPGSVAVAFAPRHLVGRQLPLSLAGMLTVATGLGMLVLPAAWLVPDSALLGLSTALVFVLALALPPLLTHEGDTHRLSAAIFTIAYACPFLGSLLGGGLWDLTGIAQTAFLPLIAGGLLMLFLPWRLDLSRARSQMSGAHLAEAGVLTQS